ncbi:MAG: SusE domain-containing protein [Bacteroidaceae bacterium]|nr:SusE domain-containing protein [Bacteroidaceae bacterium]
MKNLLYSALLLVGGICLMACEDDNGSNPTLQQPTDFVMNTPAYSDLNVDLANSKSLKLSCQQPDFGYTAAVKYQLQVSLTNDFSVSYAEAKADESGNTVATYATVNEAYTGVSFEATPSLVAKALQQCGQWPASEVPETVTAYARLLATVENYSVASNVVTLHFIPYYVELQAKPDIWYFIGGGVNGWTTGSIGEFVVPISLKAGETYNDETGQGIFEHTGYFKADQFKLIQDPNAWAPMLGVSDEASFGNGKDWSGSAKLRAAEGDDDPACWRPAADGFYTFTLDTSAGLGGTKVTVKWADDQNPKTYGGIAVGGVDLTPNAVVSHIWFGDVTLGSDSELEVVATDGTVWRNKQFPYAVGTAEGDKIKAKAGTYRVVFNDITGCYHFINQ